jgi:hypothetical protein
MGDFNQVPCVRASAISPELILQRILDDIVGLMDEMVVLVPS